MGALLGRMRSLITVRRTRRVMAEEQKVRDRGGAMDARAELGVDIP